MTAQSPPSISVNQRPAADCDGTWRIGQLLTGPARVLLDFEGFPADSL